MITISEAVAKMVDYSNADLHDINHFMRVWGYAKTIGEMEDLDLNTQQTLEFAAIVHDIACPMLRKEHGSAPGDLQEKYGPDLARAFYEGCGLSDEMLERICYLVGHHHTYKNVNGLDYQILLEADYLVNCGEQDSYHNAVKTFHDTIFKTTAGLRLLESIYMS